MSQYDEPLYRRIPNDNTHPAKSKRVDGAISGAALDNDTNRPCGASDFMPVEGLTEEEFIRRQEMAAFWSPIITDIMDWTYDRTMIWLDEKALPMLKNKIIPAVKESASEWGENIVIAIGDKILKKYEESKAGMGKPSRNKSAVISTNNLPKSKSEAFDQQTDNNTSDNHINQDEFDQLTSMAKLHALYLASYIRLLSSVYVDDNVESNFFEQQKEVELLLTENVKKSIDLLLSDENRALLDDVTYQLILNVKEGKPLFQNSER